MRYYLKKLTLPLLRMNRFNAFKVFVVTFILYFAIHMIVGFVHCINTDYANCPGNEELFSDKEDDFDD